ncbi:MAG: RNA 2',3'-cyclic phosphodiesterase [Gammaproteobacteria bacterium]
MSEQTYIHTFLAVIPPADIIQQLTHTVEGLKALTDLAEVKWYVPEKLHITLQFLGPINLGQVQALSAKLMYVMNDQMPLSISLGDIIVFPSLQHPKVIAAEVNHSPELLALTQHILPLTLQCGISAPDFSFNGHLTLGRLPHKRFSVANKLILSDTRHLTWVTRSIYLMESTGGRYIQLAEYKCGDSN